MQPPSRSYPATGVRYTLTRSTRGRPIIGTTLCFPGRVGVSHGGIYLPGREVAVGSVQFRFPAPLCYPSCQVKLRSVDSIELAGWVFPRKLGSVSIEE
jgi:hypothetical protein